METPSHLVEDIQNARRHPEPPNETPVVVTLVHGTFATAADWTKDGSKLRRQIADALGEQGRSVHFDAFEWSGRNTHKARIKAGYELADHVSKLRKSYPSCSHFIVAHSHGGNIALFAHKHLPEKLHSLGIATLGTPFLYAKLKDDLQKMSLRSLEQEVMGERDILSGVFAFTLAILAFLIIQSSIKVGSSDLFGWMMVAAATLLTFAITYPLIKFVLFPRLAPALHNYSGRRMALRLAKAIEFPRLPRTHVLSFAYPHDEAARLLDGLELFTKAPTWLMKSTLGVGFACMVPFFFLHFYAEKVQGFAGAFQEFLGPQIATTAGQAVELASNALVLIGLTIGLLWLVLAGVRSLLSLLRGHPWGFGWESPFLHNWAEIGAQRSPEFKEVRSGFTEVVPLKPSPQVKGMRHNHFYDDARILKALSYWIAQVSAPQSTSETEQRRAS